MARRLGIATACAVAIAGLILGGGVLAMRSVGADADLPATSTAVAEDADRDSVLPARRVAAHGTSLPVLLALATAGIAGIAMAGGVRCGRRLAVGARAPSLLGVPWGTRAPPPLRVV